MENFKDLLARFFSKKDARRLCVELCVAVAVGIIVGCITYSALGGEKKELTVSDEAAAAPVVEGEQNDAVVTGEGLSEDDPDANVVINVVEDSENTNRAGCTDYADELSSWSTDEIFAAASERSDYISKTKYSSVVNDFWEKEMGVTDIDWQARHMFDTDKKVYSASDFEGLTPATIHVIKNEIYARHGYSFKDSDLYNYFMCYVWYSPSVMPADFSEKVFSETEVKNLDILNSIDTM